jgi:hypothetical protein
MRTPKDQQLEDLVETFHGCGSIYHEHQQGKGPRFIAGPHGGVPDRDLKPVNMTLHPHDPGQSADNLRALVPNIAGNARQKETSMSTRSTDPRSPTSTTPAPATRISAGLNDADRRAMKALQAAGVPVDEATFAAHKARVKMPDVEE